VNRTPFNLLARCLGPVSMALLALGACSDDDSSSSPTVQLPPRIAVTSVKGDVKSELLAAIYARVLEDSGFRVSRRDPVDLDRAQYYQAIQDGTFHVIPEFTGDLLAFVYSQPGAPTAPTTSVPTGTATTVAPVVITTTTLAPATTVADTVADTTDDTTDDTTEDSTDDTTGDETTTTGADTTTTEDPALTTTTTIAPLSSGRSIAEQVIALNDGLPDSLVVNSGASAQEKQSIACTPAAMDANGDVELFTLTNLASIAPEITLAGPASFFADEETGFPAWERFYGGEFADTVEVEDADLATAIADESADCFVINSLNPLITTEDLTVLTDDQLMVPANAVIALMASTIATPEAVFALDNLVNTLTTERLNQMLNLIINDGSDPEVVANAFVDTL
jgi:glycine betaine/choline ABC-type transport system substrate-binding protein